MEKITFSILGGGWRAEFYLRIANLLPDVFEVSAICVRNAQKAKELKEKYNCNTVATIEDLLETPFDFIVNCINKDDISKLSIDLAKKGYAVLSETPAILNVEDAKMIQKADTQDLKIQVAEQYHLLPLYQAIQAVIDNGVIGDVNYVEIASAHDYHAMSLIRRFLKVEHPPKAVLSTSFDTEVLYSHTRSGELSSKAIRSSEQTVKIFDFGNKKAVYNFSHDMYFSPIRKKHLLIRGTRGEIENDTVRYFNESNQYVESKIMKRLCGDLDGFFHENITFENRVVYQSLFKGIRISEEEEAIAMCLLKMKDYLKNGTEFYSFSQAVLDCEYFMQNQ